MQLLDEKGVTTVDTTCPWVSKVGWHTRAARALLLLHPHRHHRHPHPHPHPFHQYHHLHQ